MENQQSNDLFTLVRDFVKQNFSEKKMPHFDRTVYWVEQFKSPADEAMRIAAISHDIERAFQGEGYDKINASAKGFTDEDHLKYHQEKGAEIVADFLKEHEADNALIERVKHLISKHEVGGDEDQNILKDADSVSFLETQINMFLGEKVKTVGKDKVRTKFDWMFDRITSPHALEIARPLYEDAIKKLDSIV